MSTGELEGTGGGAAAQGEGRVRTAAAAVAALVAFAANSILCRLALASGAIDAASFTTLRLLSGAATLWLAARLVGRRRLGGNWGLATALFAYAAGFSFAYLSLPAGVGALVLFAAVQATMVLGGVKAGERPRARQWIGLALALVGLVGLTSPGLSAPPLAGSLLMAGAGVAWGVYSLNGRGSGDALAATAGSFLRAAAPALLLTALLLPRLQLTPLGLAWAVTSGAITSGLGYVAWFVALDGLTATRAAVIQLLVPVLAAAAGVALLGETMTVRLVLASAAILGGVALAVLSRPSPR